MEAENGQGVIDEQLPRKGSALCKSVEGKQKFSFNEVQIRFSEKGNEKMADRSTASMDTGRSFMLCQGVGSSRE